MADSHSPSIGLRISSDPDVTRIEQPRAEPAREVEALPLRVLYVADLTPRAQPDWTAGSRVVSVDRYTFPDLFRSLAPQLRLEVPNHLSDTPKRLEVDLHFDGLKAFHPAEVARQVPVLARLLQLRDLVAQVKEGRTDLEAFRARLEAVGVEPDEVDRLYRTLAAPPPASSPRPANTRPSSGEGGDALDRLLGMVDAGEAAPGPAPADDPGAAGPTGLADALIGALAGPSSDRPRASASAADRLLADLDDVIARQVDALLTHPDFRRLEAAWRGLHFLVERFDPRKGLRLDVLAAPKAALSEALYHQVLLPEHRATERTHVPLTALVLGHLFGHEPAEIDLLADLAETAASLQVPCIAGVDATFFGVAAPTGLNKLPVVWQHLDGPAYIPWQKLRQRPEAQHLALAVPPLLLRPAYDDRHPVRAFRYAETGYLWGSGALAVAAAMARSFADTGWPTHLAGTAERHLDNLPTWPSPSGQTPLAALLTEQKQGELRDAGFVVLGGRPDRDVVYLTQAPTVARPPHYDSAEANREAWAHASLACRLFTARAAQFLLRFQHEQTPGADLADVEVELRRRLRGFLQGTGPAWPDDAIHVEYVPEAATDAYDVLAVRLQPPPAVLDYPVRLVLAVQVPRAEA